MTREQLERLLAQQVQSGRDSRLDTLSESELEVFSLLSEGYSGSQIHSLFAIDPERLSVLKRGIREKLGLKNDAQLLRLAAEQKRLG